MKKFTLSLFFAFACISFTQAAEGDTTRIQSHQDTHWDWNGNWYDTTQFPAAGNYRKIIMYYTLGCPSTGCSGWDYTTKIEIGDPINSTQNRWVELTRIITPYAGDKDSEWKHTWAFDVTDFAPILTGERSVRANYGGWQDGFTVTINFDFIEGTPPREVLALNTLYDGTFKYGRVTNPIEDHLIPVDIDILSNTVSAKHRLVASGHSFTGNENCAEFCSKWYLLKINGGNVVQQNVWRDDCGSNVLDDQTGTWIYNRAGWCPGDIATPMEKDITENINIGQSNTFNIDWQPFTHDTNGTGDPQYIIEALVFQYGPWNFDLDASMDNIIKPSNADRNMQVNPICNNPEVVVSNTGKNSIQKIKIKYWVEGTGEELYHEWGGLLKSGESTNIELPSGGIWLFAGKSSNKFYAEIVEINGSEDDYASNNQMVSSFESTNVFPAKILIAFTNNNVNNETTYKIIDEYGETVYERSNSAPNAAYKDTVNLTFGCYTLLVEDAGCDGLEFFQNNDGTGRFWIQDPEQLFPPLAALNTAFGCEEELNFTVGYELGYSYPTGVQEVVQNMKLWVYPNPSDGVVTIAVQNFSGKGVLEIYNTAGQRVQSLAMNNGNSLNVEGLNGGNYIAKFVSDDEIQTASFVVVR